jgi:hypothetical protein
MRSRLNGILFLLLALVPVRNASGQHPVFELPYNQEVGFKPGNKLSRNAIHLELAGPGVLYSVNFEHHFTAKLSLRAGLSIWSIDSLDLILLQIKNFKFRSFPVMVNYLIGKKSSHLELGLGIQPVFMKGEFDVFYFIHADEQDKGSGILGLSTIGYRYQKDEGGLIFRIGVNPVISSDGIYPAAGLSLGYGF